MLKFTTAFTDYFPLGLLGKLSRRSSRRLIFRRGSSSLMTLSTTFFLSHRQSDILADLIASLSGLSILAYIIIVAELAFGLGPAYLSLSTSAYRTDYPHA